jgi:metal-responsive CopG/Arc/MetJ family transcriptional regulator
MIMRETITISLPASLRKRLDRLVEDYQLNRSDLVREALRQYLHREEFHRLRRAMIPRAEAAGVHTDEDVFERVS